MEEALAALSASALGRTMRGSLWLYPAANTAHVLAAATVFGMILATDLRALGFGRALPVDALLRLTLPGCGARPRFRSRAACCCLRPTLR
jgi:hypothetical protein